MDQKYEIVWVVQGLYIGEEGIEWEDVYEDTDKAVSEDNLRRYDENEPTFRHRLVRRKIVIL